MSMFKNWLGERDEISGGLTGQGSSRGFERYDQDDGQRQLDCDLVQTHVNAHSLPEGEERSVAVVDQVFTGLNSQGHQRLASTPAELQRNLTAGSRPVNLSAWDTALQMQSRLNGEDDE